MSRTRDPLGVPEPPRLGPEERARAAIIVHAALDSLFGVSPGGRHGSPGAGKGGETVGVLGDPHPLFVTLELDGDLRGCIGTTSPGEPLADALRSYAVAAATRDPRFPPLEREERDRLEVEVSILGPLRELPRDPDRILRDLRPGEHGLQVTRDRQRGLLLPQVAARYALDAEAFLEMTARKAGLPPSSWREPETRVQAFRADCFPLERP